MEIIKRKDKVVLLAFIKSITTNIKSSIYYIALKIALETI